MKKDLSYLLDSNERCKFIRKAASEGFVLLKNENSVLPIKDNDKIVLFGRTQIDTYKGVTTVAEMYLALLNDDLNQMLRLLQAYLLTVPQCDNTNYEGHYQQLLYVIFSLLGRYVDVEVRTANGRVDMVMNSGKALYLFELKLNKSAEAAMNQINLKDYPSRFALSGQPIVKVGINFDLERHILEDWIIEA